MNGKRVKAWLIGAGALAPALALAHAGGAHESFSLVEYLGRFHPVVIHFPIALMIAAAFAELLNLILRREPFSAAARFLVVLAALAAPVAVSLGWAAESTLQFSAEYQGVIETHEGLALTATGLAIIAAVLSELGRRRNDPRLIQGYRVALLAAAVAVTATGFFGGELVYGIGHYRP
jgi:uncharacterized membrane protein